LVAGSVPDGYPGGVLAGAFRSDVGPKILTVKTGQEHVMRDGRFGAGLCRSLFLHPRSVVDPTVVVGHGPGRRRSPGTFNRRIREHSEGSSFGVDDADLEAFDRVLQDLDVHCRQRE